MADLIETGICLAGGGAQLLGLSERLADELHLRVWVAEDPMTCVARGCGMILEHLKVVGGAAAGAASERALQLPLEHVAHDVLADLGVVDKRQCVVVESGVVALEQRFKFFVILYCN